MAEFLQYCVFYLLRSLDHEGMHAAKIVGHRNLKEYREPSCHCRCAVEFRGLWDTYCAIGSVVHSVS